jgi:DNA (cytosine-5)-methyltransferase 1
LVAPYLVPRHGERPGQAPLTHAADAPAPTIDCTANSAQLVAAFLAQHNTERGAGAKAGRSADMPVSTITTSGNHQSVVAAFLAQHDESRLKQLAQAYLERAA